MAEGIVTIMFAISDPPPEFVRGTIERCTDCGFALLETPEGRRPRSQPDPQERIESVEAEGGGRIELRYRSLDSKSMKIGFGLDSDTFPHPLYDLVFDPEYLSPTLSELPAEQHQSLIDAIVNFVRKMVTYVDIEHGWSMWTGREGNRERPAKLSPEDTPVSEHISAIPWFGVYAPETIEAFGGRDHVLETPAWRVEEFQTGHILVITSDDPLEPMNVPDGSPEKYLLGS